jgi:hypothetical protein
LTRHPGLPAEIAFDAELDRGNSRWQIPRILEDLKAKAKVQGLWNLFLSKQHEEGAGFTNLEYGLMAEVLGRSKLGPEVSILSKTGGDRSQHFITTGYQLLCPRHWKYGAFGQVRNTRPKGHLARPLASRRHQISLCHDGARCSI